MAEVLSRDTAESLAAPQQRVLRFLKTLPEGCRIWTHFHAGEVGSPDFLVMDPHGRALLVKLSLARPAAAVPAAQLPLLADERPPLGLFEIRVLEQFIQRLPGIELALAVVFPYITQKQLAVCRPCNLPDKVSWLGREALQPGGERLWIQAFKSPALNEQQQLEVQLRFAPEAALPAELCSPASAGCMLDPWQERAVKAGFDRPEGKPPAEPAVWLAGGPYGSGKTTALLCRLRLHYEVNPRLSALVLAPAASILAGLRRRAALLSGYLSERIEWQTLSGWCREHWPTHPAWVEPLSQQRRQGFIRAVWRALFKDSDLSPADLAQEFDWIKDQEVWSRESYLKARRRPTALAERIYTAFERYRRIQKEKRTPDWGDIPHQILMFIEEGVIRPPSYDLVLVDDGHFFPPVAYRLISHMLKPGGELLISAEPRPGHQAPWRAARRSVRTFRLQGQYGADCAPDPEILFQRISDEERDALITLRS